MVPVKTLQAAGDFLGGDRFLSRVPTPLTDACCSQSERELREPEESCTPGPMAALAERTLPFMDNASSSARGNKTGAV